MQCECLMFINVLTITQSYIFKPKFSNFDRHFCIWNIHTHYARRTIVQRRSLRLFLGAHIIYKAHFVVIHTLKNAPVLSHNLFFYINFAIKTKTPLTFLTHNNG